MYNKYPVILVHGILGFGPKELGRLNYWGSAVRVPSSVERHEASVGPLSSAHDAACELAAQIKGTKVDYEVQHANNEQHNRYGYNFTNNGFVQDWNEDNPVHLIGHSLGSPTIRCLQNLLYVLFFICNRTNRFINESGVTCNVCLYRLQKFRYTPIPVTNFSSSDWGENGGAVSTYSQMYPRTNGSHPVGLEFDENTPVNHLTRGAWHYTWERNVDHLDICILPQKGQIDWQRRFYQGLF